MADIFSYIPDVLHHIEQESELLEHNKKLFRIVEGDLLTYVEEDLEAQLSPKNFNVMKGRIAPINVLKKIITKKSRIYAKEPERTITPDDNTNMELLEYYERTGNLNTHMQDYNEFFNLFKNSALEPFAYMGKPNFRVIPSNQFTVWSNDKVNPLNPTVFAKFMGDSIKKDGAKNRMVSVYILYTNDQIIAVDSDGDLYEPLMLENPEGINPYGRIPFVYINRSRFKLIPLADTDTFRMTKLIPVLLSDLSYAQMFAAFSVVYGIDIDAENLEWAPSALWNIRSDSSSDKKPELGVIKPEVDTDKTLSLIHNLLTFWLESINIKPGSVGKLNGDNFQSGVSKMIDEMDATQDLIIQKQYFQESENRLWDLIINHMHPVWSTTGQINERRQFSAGAEVSVEFAEMKPTKSRKELIEEAKAELDAGLTSKRRSIKMLNPNMSEEEVDSLLEEINEESGLGGLLGPTESQDRSLEEA